MITPFCGSLFLSNNRHNALHFLSERCSWRSRELLKVSRAEIPDAKRRFNAAEHLLHTTKKNHACFGFDIRFPKMPSYLRRSAIQHALGTVSSYKKRLNLWEKTDGKSGKPRHLPRLWKRDTRSIFCVFPIKRK